MPQASEQAPWWHRFAQALGGLLGRSQAGAPGFADARPSTEIAIGAGERRSQVRVPIELRVAVRFDSIEDVLKSHTVDLSHAGVFISTMTPRKVGTKVRVKMTVADQVVELHGRVARCVPPAEADSKAPGMGVNFGTLAVDAQELVDRIVAKAKTGA